MKLHWFSPIPPARSAVAVYTAQLLPTLASCAEVTVWTEQRDWDRELDNHATIRRYPERGLSWSLLNDADACVYHIGNNVRFHGTILDVCRVLPGLVVLHDTRLHDLVLDTYLQHRRDAEGYLRLMERLHGREGRFDAELLLQGALDMAWMSPRYPLTEFALERAIGAVVHTQTAARDLSGHRGLPIIYAPLPYQPIVGMTRHRADLRAWRRDAPCRLVIFGHFGWNRRVLPLLQALATMPERNRFRLDIYGEFDGKERRDEIDAALHRLGLTALATIHGFVSDEELVHALNAAHMAINLRYPAMGEASFSQLQIWSHALPSMVTRVGWFADLPPDTVAFIRPNAEIADVCATLRAFLADPDRFARMGTAGYHFLTERHAPLTYARTITDLAARRHHLLLDAAATSLAERVGERMAGWVNPLTPDTVFSTAARQIATMLSCHDDEIQGEQ